MEDDEQTMEVRDRDSPPSSNRARKEPPSAMSSLGSRPASISRRPASLKGTARTSATNTNPSINSLNGSGNGSAKAPSLPTALAVFGLGPVKSEVTETTTVEQESKPSGNGLSIFGADAVKKEESTTEIQRLVTDLPRKKRVLAAEEPEVMHRGDVGELPVDMEGMKLE